MGDAHFPLHLLSGNYVKSIAQQRTVDNDMLVSLQKNITLLKLSKETLSLTLERALSTASVTLIWPVNPVVVTLRTLFWNGSWRWWKLSSAGPVLLTENPGFPIHHKEMGKHNQRPKNRSFLCPYSERQRPSSPPITQPDSLGRNLL